MNENYIFNIQSKFQLHSTNVFELEANTYRQMATIHSTANFHGLSYLYRRVG